MVGTHKQDFCVCVAHRISLVKDHVSRRGGRWRDWEVLSICWPQARWTGPDGCHGCRAGRDRPSGLLVTMTSARPDNRTALGEACPRQSCAQVLWAINVNYHLNIYQAIVYMGHRFLKYSFIVALGPRFHEFVDWQIPPPIECTSKYYGNQFIDKSSPYGKYQPSQVCMWVRRLAYLDVTRSSSAGLQG